MTDETALGNYPEVLVPLETAGPQTVLVGNHWRALFGELHRLHDVVAELQKAAREQKGRAQT